MAQMICSLPRNYDVMKFHLDILPVFLSMFCFFSPLREPLCIETLHSQGRRQGCKDLMYLRVKILQLYRSDVVTGGIVGKVGCILPEQFVKGRGILSRIPSQRAEIFTFTQNRIISGKL